MKYIYVPNSYDYTIIEEKYNNDEFVDLQVKYRNYLENFLNNFIDFKKVDQKINEVINIPKNEDAEYNFYHKFSTLGSDYIYLRNNYHIENLSDDEVNVIKNNKIDFEFLNKTISKVIFEKGDNSFFGTPILDNLGNSKGLVFEFSFNQLKLQEVKEFKMIDEIVLEITNFLKKNLGEKLNIPVSVISYNGIKDLYKPKIEEELQNTKKTV